MLAARKAPVTLNGVAASMVVVRRIGGGKSEGGGDRKGGDKGEAKRGMGYGETAVAAAAEYVATSAAEVVAVRMVGSMM